MGTSPAGITGSVDPGDLIESFFVDAEDYLRFLLRLSETQRVADDFSCIASLKKVGDQYLYELAWKDGRFVAEYLRPFRANEEDLRMFHAGCKEIARRLRIFLETEDESQVPNEPPAFGDLSCEPTKRRTE